MVVEVVGVGEVGEEEVYVDVDGCGDGDDGCVELEFLTSCMD